MVSSSQKEYIPYLRLFVPFGVHQRVWACSFQKLEWHEGRHTHTDDSFLNIPGNAFPPFSWRELLLLRLLKNLSELVLVRSIFFSFPLDISRLRSSSLYYFLSVMMRLKNLTVSIHYIYYFSLPYSIYGHCCGGKKESFSSFFSSCAPL